MCKAVPSNPTAAAMNQSRVKEESDGANRVKESDISVLIAAIKSAVGQIEVDAEKVAEQLGLSLSSIPPKFTRIRQQYNIRIKLVNSGRLQKKAVAGNGVTNGNNTATTSNPKKTAATPTQAAVIKGSDAGCGKVVRFVNPRVKKSASSVDHKAAAASALACFSKAAFRAGSDESYDDENKYDRHDGHDDAQVECKRE